MLLLTQGYAPEEISFWWIIIGIGFLVVLVVIALLSLLISIVKSIDRGVIGVRDTLRAVKENTGTTWMIPEIAAGVDAILDEGLNHHLFLTRELTSAPRKKAAGSRGTLGEAAKESATGRQTLGAEARGTRGT